MKQQAINTGSVQDQRPTHRPQAFKSSSCHEERLQREYQPLQSSSVAEDLTGKFHDDCWPYQFSLHFLVLALYLCSFVALIVRQLAPKLIMLSLVAPS